MGVIRKKHRLFTLVLLMLFGALLLPCQDSARAESPLDTLAFDIPVTITIVPEQQGVTPDPGAAVFHFNIWSEAGVPLNIAENAVYTSGYGSFEGHLTFTTSSPVDARMAMSEGLVIQQYDGNDSWSFDTTPVVYDWDYNANRPYQREPHNLVNIYRPAAPTPPPTEPAPPERVTLSIPAVVNVIRASEAVPDPGPAVFHFNVWSDSGADIQPVNSAVFTNGFGEFRGSLDFTVPSSQLDALKASTLRILQFGGNGDWLFDTYVFEFFYDPENGTFMRWPRTDGGVVPPRVKSPEVYVTNTYAPAQAAPVPTEPAPTEPVPEQPAVGEVTVSEDGSQAQFTLPVGVKVIKYGQDAPPPAVFHFGLYGMPKNQQYQWVNDVVTTSGEGETQGSISFTVPAGEQLEQLIETGFDVRERTAVVSGWSFAGEMYHIALFREGGILKARAERIRSGLSGETGDSRLSFLNYYGMSGGQPVSMPTGTLGLQDMLRELLASEFMICRDTFHIYHDNSIWEISWRALKKGSSLGDMALNLGYSKDGGEYSRIALADVLRVTPEGIFIRLGQIADACRELSGKELPAAYAIPEGDWTAFTPETISWLELPALDALFARMWRDAGPVFDTLDTESLPAGFRVTGTAEQLNGARQTSLGAAQKNHEEWYGLAEKAAISEDMKELAFSYEDAFTRFIDAEADEAELLRQFDELFPARAERITFSLEQTGEASFSSWLSFGIAGAKNGSWSFDNDFLTEASTVEAVNLTAPETYSSGSDYLHELIMMLALGGRQGEEPETTAAPEAPSDDPAGADPEPPENSEELTADTALLKCYVQLNNTYAPKYSEGYYAKQVTAIWVILRNETNRILQDVRWYDAATGDPILYDRRVYPQKEEGSSWYMEEFKPGYSETLMYYHEITPEEALAGNISFKVFAEGRDFYNGNLFTSNTAEIELKTSGTYRPEWWEEEKPRPTELTIDLHESSQSEHEIEYDSYYEEGETIRYKVVLKNETGNPFFNIDVGLEGDDTVLRHFDMLQYGEDDSFTFELPAEYTDTDEEFCKMTIRVWVRRDNAYHKRKTVYSDPCTVYTRQH